MATSNKELLNRYSSWNQSDLNQYIDNKEAWGIAKASGNTAEQQRLSSANTSLRNQYGAESDAFNYYDMAHLRTQDPQINLPPAPTMRSGQSMADHLGVRYDYNEIRDLMRNATEEQYNNMDNEFRRSQDVYYDSVASNADALLGVMRRGDREAAMTGATRGTQSAQELAMMMGASAEASAGATEMVQARDDLVRQRESALAQVETDALKYYNDLGLNLGQLSASELNALVTAYAAEVAALGGIYNTDVLAGVERDRIASGERISYNQIASTERIEAGRITSNENIAKWLNETNITIAELNALSNEKITEMTGATSKEIEEMRIKANARYSSGSYSSGGSGTYRASGGGGSTSTYGQITEQDRVGLLQEARGMLLDADGNLPSSLIPRWNEIQAEIERITGVPQMRAGRDKPVTKPGSNTTIINRGSGSGTLGTTHQRF